MVFWILARRARRLLALQGIHHTRHVFGLLRDGRVDANYVASLLKNLPRGDSELYSHPSLDEARHELDALTCPKARRLIETMGIRLARYQDLS